MFGYYLTYTSISKGGFMIDRDRHSEDGEPAAALAVGTRVRVHRGQAGEAVGTVVEDFGQDVGVPVMVGTTEITGPARRWAVVLDGGELICLDTDDLTVARP
jgi:hypothetical protein